MIILRKRGILNSIQKFNPLSLSPALWLDASDISTIISSGSPLKVSQWNDKSGNGRNFSQSVLARQPETQNTSINSLNVIDFNGNNRLEKLDDEGMRPSQFTTFIVFQSLVSVSREDIFASGNSSTFPSNNWIHGKSNTSQSFFGRTPQSPINSGFIDNVSTAVWIHDGSLLKGLVNGVQTFNTASTIGTDNENGQFIGASSRSGLMQTPFTGYICEILFFPSVLDQDDIFNVAQYLALKWGTG